MPRTTTCFLLFTFTVLFSFYLLGVRGAWLHIRVFKQSVARDFAMSLTGSHINSVSILLSYWLFGIVGSEIHVWVSSSSSVGIHRRLDDDNVEQLDFRHRNRGVRALKESLRLFSENPFTGRYASAIFNMILRFLENRSTLVFSGRLSVSVSTRPNLKRSGVCRRALP